MFVGMMDYHFEVKPLSLCLLKRREVSTCIQDGLGMLHEEARHLLASGMDQKGVEAALRTLSADCQSASTQIHISRQ